MTWLKQSTTVTIQVGPFLDATDGVTEETGLSPTVEVSKNGGAFAARNSATSISHDADGWYTAELDGTDTNTLGRLVVKSQDSANHLPVWHEFTVVPANVYDSLVSGSDSLQVDTIQLSGDSTAADNAESFFDGTGYAGTNNVIPTVTTVTNQVSADVTAISGDMVAADNAELFFDNTGFNASNSTIGTCTTNTDMRGTDDALLAAGAPSNFSDLSITPTNGRVSVGSFLSTLDLTATMKASVNTEADTALTDYDPPTKAELDAGFAALNDPSAASIADAVWDEVRSGHTTAGTFGEGVASVQGNVTGSVGSVTATVSANAIEISGDATAADNLEAAFDGTGGVTFDASFGSAGVDAIWAKAMSEPGSVPATTASVLAALQWLFVLSRNKITQDSSTQTLRNNADSVSIGTAAVGDDGTTFTRDKWA